MRVKISPNPEKEGFFTIIPYGPIDSETYQDFQKNVDPLLVKTTKGILANLAGVDYISSAGLGVLFNIRKYLKGNGGELYFCNLQPQIKKLFEVVKALPPQTLFNSIQEADRYFYKVMNEEIEKEKKK